MELPEPIKGDNHKLVIADVTNRMLRDLVVKYSAKQNKTPPLTVATELWGSISWIWRDYRQEVEATVKQYLPEVADVETWLKAEYAADMAKYKDQPTPA